MREIIAVCLRPIDAAARLNERSGQLESSDLALSLSGADAAALEVGLRLGQLWQLPVVAVTAGGAASTEALRIAASLGARTLRVPSPSDEAGAGLAADLGADEQALAGIVAAAIRTEGSPQIVVCGDRSIDRGTGAFPAFLAHELDAAQACGLMSVSLSSEEFRAVRRLDGGRREVLRISAPSVCAVEAGAASLRRASPWAAMDAAVPTDAPKRRPAPAARFAIGAPLPHRPPATAIQPPSGVVLERLSLLVGLAVSRRSAELVTPPDASAAADAFLAFLDAAERGTRSGGDTPAG